MCFARDWGRRNMRFFSTNSRKPEPADSEEHSRKLAALALSRFRVAAFLGPSFRPKKLARLSELP
jgi:hypothetical protein